MLGREPQLKAIKAVRKFKRWPILWKCISVSLLLGHRRHFHQLALIFTAAHQKTVKNSAAPSRGVLYRWRFFSLRTVRGFRASGWMLILVKKRLHSLWCFQPCRPPPQVHGYCIQGAMFYRWGLLWPAWPTSLAAKTTMGWVNRSLPPVVPGTICCQCWESQRCGCCHWRQPAVDRGGGRNGSTFIYAIVKYSHWCVSFLFSNLLGFRLIWCVIIDVGRWRRVVAVALTPSPFEHQRRLTDSTCGMRETQRTLEWFEQCIAPTPTAAKPLNNVRLFG